MIINRDKKCFEKAVARNDSTFTLVGQDLTSPAVICEWIKLNIETAPAVKLRDALESALIMRGKEYGEVKRKQAD